MPTLEELAEEVEKIQKRNARVEADKAWEVSMTRKVLIALLTYIVVVSVFLVAKLPDPFVNALVPSVAFLLSTLTVPVCKKWWVRKNP